MLDHRWGPGVTREGLEAALDEARALFLLDPTTKVPELKWDKSHRPFSLFFPNVNVILKRSWKVN